MSEDQRVPTVFVSYSHDSKVHKLWILELAQRLRGEHIEVILDQWDLGYGDDVPKFMERWVTDAERVLMICTEPYVQKVDSGVGGVGYEAMIVTQELVRDLGTKKFIPVIRQDNPPILLPKCVGSRLAVNLSNYYAQKDEEFGRLIEQLHQIPPPTKPPLGTNPKLKIRTQSAIGSRAVTLDSDATDIYEQALNSASSADLVGWRRLIARLRDEATSQLSSWRDDKVDLPSILVKELPDLARSGISIFQRLFAAALAGIESGQPKFSRQASMLHDLLAPSGWEFNGPTLVVNFPEMAAFVFQALAGSMCIHSNQVGLALDLATQRIKTRSMGSFAYLYATSRLTGWPETLERNCTTALRFLVDMPKHYPWISSAFGSEQAFKEALCGYYLVLTWTEYMDFLKAGKGSSLGQGELHVESPPFFLALEEREGGRRKLLEDRLPLQRHAEQCGVNQGTDVACWPKWMTHLRRWQFRVWHSSRLVDEDNLDHFAADLWR